MAKVLIQRGIQSHLNQAKGISTGKINSDTDAFRNNLETQSIKRLRGMPKRIKYLRKSDN